MRKLIQQTQQGRREKQYFCFFIMLMGQMAISHSLYKISPQRKVTPRLTIGFLAALSSERKWSSLLESICDTV